VSDSEVSYVDNMGSDLSVVNAARVSFGKTSTQLTERDKGLIRFLARGCMSGEWSGMIARVDEAEKLSEIEEILHYVKQMPVHWTPFAHTSITLHVTAPIFVARQLGKHQVGLVWNEISRRYVDQSPELYRPFGWRKRAESVKQGSSDELVDLNDFYADGVTIPEEDAGTEIQHEHPSLAETLDAYLYNAGFLYDSMIKASVCPEQARMILPQSMMTEWYWTGSLYAFANVFIQRAKDPHAQVETNDVAQQIEDIVKPLYPVAWDALVYGD